MTMWELMENGRLPKHRGVKRYYNDDYNMGMKYSDDYKEEIDDAYECGYEEGYRKAKRELSEYGEKRMGR